MVDGCVIYALDNSDEVASGCGSGSTAKTESVSGITQIII